MSATDLAVQFLDECKARKFTLATAESCTGGRIIGLLTDVPGSSAVVDRGYVTYSNAAKHEMIGVSLATLQEYGAVSREVALEMAAGALEHSGATIALSVTGIAGPAGGSAEKPVGLVWFGVAVARHAPLAESRQFENRGRDFIRAASVEAALKLGLRMLRSL